MNNTNLISGMDTIGFSVMGAGADIGGDGGLVDDRTEGGRRGAGLQG